MRDHSTHSKVHSNICIAYLHNLKPGTHWRTVAETGDTSATVDCRRYSQLCCRFWRQIEFDSLSRSTLSPTRWTLLPIRSTLSPLVCTGPKRHGRLSTKLNSTLSSVCTRLKTTQCFSNFKPLPIWSTNVTF